MKDLEKLMDMENQISDIIRGDNGNYANFIYSQKDDTHNIKVITRNKISREFFLLVSMSGSTPLDALSKSLDWLKLHKTQYNSYTVMWTKIPDGVPNKSYFWAKDMREVMDKFYDGKDDSLYKIFEIKQNPIE